MFGILTTHFVPKARQQQQQQEQQLQLQLQDNSRSSSDPAGEGTDLKVGDTVEARHGGQARWYAGRITAVDSSEEDLKYEIQYDDGDVEKVRARYQIRRPGDLAPEGALTAGEPMDARHNREKKWCVPSCE